jgi:hypothetical protein
MAMAKKIVGILSDAIFLIVLPILSAIFWPPKILPLVHSFVFAVFLFGALSFWRSIPFRLLPRLFLLGLGVGVPISKGLRWTELFPSPQWIYFGIEVALLLSLFSLFLWISRWRHIRYSGGPLDWCLLGCALGAGFDGSTSDLPPQILGGFGGYFAGWLATIVIWIGLACRLPRKRLVWILTALGATAVCVAEGSIELAHGISKGFLLCGLLLGFLWSRKVIRNFENSDPDGAFGMSEAAHFIEKGLNQSPQVFWLCFSLVRLTRGTAFAFHEYLLTEKSKRIDLSRRIFVMRLVVERMKIGLQRLIVTENRT